MTQDEIIEMAIQGHASTRDAIRWAMNHERGVCALIADSMDAMQDGAIGKAIRARAQADGGCMTQDEAFKKWWHNEGSQAPYTHHASTEEHTMRMCEIAWANGAFVERDACAKVCDELWIEEGYDADAVACYVAIRARGEA
jgi:hypothetical protein